jgi:hypothetical protein
MNRELLNRLLPGLKAELADHFGGLSRTLLSQAYEALEHWI